MATAKRKVVKKSTKAARSGLPPDTEIRAVMTSEVKYCFEDEDLEHVARNMGQIQVRRLPVLSREKRVVGIVSLGDISKTNDPDPAGKALSNITQPGGQHTQSAKARG